MTEDFQIALREENMADNTIVAYMHAIKNFGLRYKVLNKKNLLLYKAELIEQFSPKTVNLRIQGINKYLDHIGKSKLRLKGIKVQQRTYLEHVISEADYTYLKSQLRQEPDQRWYFVVRFLGATGARISELIKFKVEHIELGYVDLYTKGGKVRRLFIPENLRLEAKLWLQGERSSGHIFLNSWGRPITTRRIAQKLKELAVRYGIDPKVVYPHSFRHRYAKNFLAAFNDIALLADLMGHESIETTRIYLRRTATEQQQIVDKVITW